MANDQQRGIDKEGQQAHAPPPSLLCDLLHEGKDLQLEHELQVVERIALHVLYKPQQIVCLSIEPRDLILLNVSALHSQLLATKKTAGKGGGKRHVSKPWVDC